MCEESSDIEIELRLLLSSRSKMNDRTKLELFLWDTGRLCFDARPRKDDCNVEMEKSKVGAFLGR